VFKDPSIPSQCVIHAACEVDVRHEGVFSQERIDESCGSDSTLDTLDPQGRMSTIDGNPHVLSYGVCIQTQR